jgi:hypothetical protein
MQIWIQDANWMRIRIRNTASTTIVRKVTRSQNKWKIEQLNTPHKQKIPFRQASVLFFCLHLQFLLSQPFYTFELSRFVNLELLIIDTAYQTVQDPYPKYLWSYLSSRFMKLDKINKFFKSNWIMYCRYRRGSIYLRYGSTTVEFIFPYFLKIQKNLTMSAVPIIPRGYWNMNVLNIRRPCIGN